MMKKLTFAALALIALASPAFAVTVTAYGAIPNDGLDDLAAFVAADAAAAGGEVYVPAGIYDLSASFTLSIGVKLRCENYASIIRIDSPTANLLMLSNGFNSVEECQFGANVTRTSGSFIEVSNGAYSLRHLLLSLPAVGINTQISTVSLFVDDVYVQSPIAGSGVGAQINGCLNCMFRSFEVFPSGGPAYAAGIAIYNAGDVTLIGSGAIGASNNLLIAPNSGQIVVSVKSVDGGFDQAVGSNVLIAPSGTGYVGRSTFDSGWASSAQVGFNLWATSPATIDGISINDIDIYGNGNGVSTFGSGVKNVEVTGNRIAGSNYAILLNGTSDTMITDNRIGQSGGFGVNAHALGLTAAPARVLLDGNNLCGNTVVVSGAAGVQSKLTADNLCYP